MGVCNYLENITGKQLFKVFRWIGVPKTYAEGSNRYENREMGYNELKLTSISDL